MTDLALLQMVSNQQRQVNSNFSTVLNSKTGTAASLSSGSQSMDEMFQHASEVTGVPVNLLKAVAKTESDFDPNCVSHAGAMGVMQLMPCNVEEYGVTDPFDAEQNIMAGAMQLADLSRQYDGDLTLTLAAYNAGSGNVAKYGGVPPFEETQNYVKKVSALVGQDISIPTTNSVSMQSTAEELVSTDDLVEDKMNQLVYLMAQSMKYSLPTLDLNSDFTTQEML